MEKYCWWPMLQEEQQANSSKSLTECFITIKKTSFSSKSRTHTFKVFVFTHTFLLYMIFNHLNLQRIMRGTNCYRYLNYYNISIPLHKISEAFLMGLNVILLKLKTKQVSSHLTRVAWVGHVSLAEVRCNSPTLLLARICQVQFSHLLNTKLACSTHLKLVFLTPTPFKRHGCSKHW